APGTLEFERQLRAAIELLDGAGCGHDQLDGAVVELVDERDEATCLVLGLPAEDRYVAQHDRVIVARDLDVIRLAARPVTELAEREPDGFIGLASRMQAAVIEGERRVDPSGLAGDLLEQS